MELVISCHECPMQATSHCDNCVVTFLSEAPHEAVVINADEERAVRMLGRAGLVPVRGHRRESSCA